MANTYQGACGRVPGVRPGANFKEAVCIDTNRVYDSVSDKNCLEDLQVTFPDLSLIHISEPTRPY